MDLWPTPNYPPVPILLESCQVVFNTRGRENRSPIERILWLYSQRKREWRQLLHVSAYSSEEWIPPIVHLATKYCSPRVQPPEPDLHQAARRIAAVIESELLGVPDNPARCLLLDTAWDYMAIRRSDLSITKKLWQIPLRPDYADTIDGLMLPILADRAGWTPSEVEEAGVPRLGM